MLRLQPPISYIPRVLGAGVTGGCVLNTGRKFPIRLVNVGKQLRAGALGRTSELPLTCYPD